MQATEPDAGVIISTNIDRSGTDSTPPTKRTIPDPLGEIPDWLTQQQVDAAEKKLQAARDHATKVGVRGLGLAGVPHLALTVPYADLVRGPFLSSPPPADLDYLCAEEPTCARSSLQSPFNSPTWEVPAFEPMQTEDFTPSPFQDAGSPGPAIEKQTEPSALGES